MGMKGEEETTHSMDEWDFDDKSLHSAKLKLEGLSHGNENSSDIVDSPSSVEESEGDDDAGDLAYSNRKGVKFDTGSMPRKGRFTVDNAAQGVEGAPVAIPVPSNVPAAEVRKGRFSVMDNSPATLPTSPMLAKSPDYFELNQQSSSSTTGEGKAGRFAYQNVSGDGGSVVAGDDSKVARKFTVTSTDGGSSGLTKAEIANTNLNMSTLDRKSRFQVVEPTTSDLHPLISEALQPVPQGLTDSELLILLKKQNETQKTLIQDLINMVKSAKSLPPTRLNSSESERDDLKK